LPGVRLPLHAPANQRPDKARSAGAACARACRGQPEAAPFWCQRPPPPAAHSNRGIWRR